VIEIFFNLQLQLIAVKDHRVGSSVQPTPNPLNKQELVAREEACSTATRVRMNVKVREGPGRYLTVILGSVMIMYRTSRNGSMARNATGSLTNGV
jgi:hypothetical protein